MIHVLELYVAGDSLRSRQARANLGRACELLLPGQHEIHVIDVQADPERAEAASVVATPLVIRTSPGPALRVVGDFADVDRVVAALHSRLVRGVTTSSSQELAPA